MFKKLLLGLVLISSVVMANWKKVEMIDQFGDKTGIMTITTEIKDGIFSNSATSNSKLEGFVRVSEDDVTFHTYEYGYARGVESTIKGSTSLRNSDGVTYQIKYTKIGKRDLKAFITGSTGDIRVVNNGRYGGVYKYSFSANGFKKKYAIISKSSEVEMLTTNEIKKAILDKLNSENKMERLDIKVTVSERNNKTEGTISYKDTNGYPYRRTYIVKKANGVVTCEAKKDMYNR